MPDRWELLLWALKAIVGLAAVYTIHHRAAAHDVMGVLMAVFALWTLFWRRGDEDRGREA